MKAGFGQRYTAIVLYLGVALLWATGAGVSKAVLIKNIKDNAAREQRLAAVKRYHESVQNNDLNGALEVLADDVKVQAPEALLRGGWRVGREEFRHLVREIKAQLPFKMEVYRALDVGANQVLALVTLRQSAANGTEEISLLELFNFQDGRICEVRMFTGAEALLKQLGSHSQFEPK